MSFLNKLLGKEEAVTVETKLHEIYMPMKGEIIPLEEIGDGVFSSEVLGKGCGIRPQEEKVYAPVNGTIASIADTKHAVGILSEEGVEVLIHVGMDTVMMNGEGFHVLVKEGQEVKCGECLMTFDMKKIKEAGYPTTSAFVITNTDECSDLEVLQYGNVEKLNPCMKAVKSA